MGMEGGGAIVFAGPPLTTRWLARRGPALGRTWSIASVRWVTCAQADSSK
jgi:hypothetical protein